MSIPVTLPWEPHPPDRVKHVFVDPLGQVICRRCPLAECILPEGGVYGYIGKKRREKLLDCPIFRADQEGWTAVEALARADELGLMPDKEDV